LDLPFHPIVQRWFSERFQGPTPAQEQGWPSIAAGRSPSPRYKMAIQTGDVTISNDGAKLLQIRFYPVDTTVFDHVAP